MGSVLGELLAVSVFAITAWSVVIVTLRQLVPAGLLGRVTSASGCSARP